MLHAVPTRLDPIDDRANIASVRVAVVCSLQIQTATADVIEALAVHPEVLPTHARSAVDRFVLSDRAPGAPHVRLPHRILSP
jgi:hypothetical protein